MTCEEARRQLELAAIDELPKAEPGTPEPAREPGAPRLASETWVPSTPTGLSAHLAACEPCRREADSLAAFHRALAAHAVAEPSANLLAHARQRLDRALDAEPRRGGFFRALALQLSGLRAAPVLASALLLAGVALGGYPGYRAGLHQHNLQQARLILAATPGARNHAAGADAAAPRPADIANVSSIVQNPNSNTVEVRYNRLLPETIEGRPDDPAIRQLLLLGVENPATPNVRDDSVNLLAAQCAAGQACAEGSVRHALMVALRYDKDPAVRLRALDGLQSYVPDDTRVRDAVLEALLNDSDNSVRERAVSLLEPVEADSSVRQVLHSVANQDDNPQLRDVSRQVLQQEPQIQ